MHLPAGGEGEDEVVVRSVEAEEAQRPFRLAAQVLRSHELEHLHGGIVQPGVEDADLLNEFAGSPHEAGGVVGITARRVLGASPRETGRDKREELLRLRVDVEHLPFAKGFRSAVGAFKKKDASVPDLLLEVRVRRNVYRGIDLRFVGLSAVSAPDLHCRLDGHYSFLAPSEMTTS